MSESIFSGRSRSWSRSRLKFVDSAALVGGILLLRPPTPPPTTTTTMKGSCRRLSSSTLCRSCRFEDSPTPPTLAHVRGRSSAVACHVGLGVFSSRFQLKRRALYQYNAYLLDENDLILPFYFGKDTFHSREVPTYM